MTLFIIRATCEHSMNIPYLNARFGSQSVVPLPWWLVLWWWFTADCGYWSTQVWCGSPFVLHGSHGFNERIGYRAVAGHCCERDRPILPLSVATRRWGIRNSDSPAWYSALFSIYIYIFVLQSNIRRTVKWDLGEELQKACCFVTFLFRKNRCLVLFYLCL